MVKKKNNLSSFFFLIYGIGKSGVSSYEYLKKNNNCFLFDDNLKNIPSRYKKKIIKIDQIKSKNFDYIILSPGIDINKCKLKNYLVQNKSKIVTDLDIFSLSHPKNKKITITGTNGKSTTSTLLFKILKQHDLDVRLTGNIGNPILAEKNINKKTIFIIEASSYQLDYSKFFRSNLGAILNLSPDHLERHGNFNNYVFSKFKLLMNQKSDDYALIENKDKNLKKLISKHKIKSKIKYVKYSNKLLKQVKNTYLNNSANERNLNFIFEIAKILRLNNHKLIKVINGFKGLKFRQQKIYCKHNLLILNDSKSTSFSSTIPLLESFKNIFWILGGLPKKNDKLILSNKYFNNINAYIYGKNSFFLKKILKIKLIIIFQATSQILLKNYLLILKKYQKSKK